MAAADATPFPIRAQAYRVYFSVRDTSGALITTWNTPVSSISKDGANFASGETPVEIQTSGLGYLDLTASQMDAACVVVKVSVSNANAVVTEIVIPTLIAEPTGHACDDSVIRFEKLVWNVFQYLMNLSTLGRSTGAMQVYKADGTTAAFSGSHTNDGTTATKTKLDNV